MPTARSLLAALTLAFTAISCSDKSPTEANTLGDQQAPTAPQVVKQPLIFPGGGQTHTAADGTVYTLQSIQVTKFGYTRAGGLTVTGLLTFTDPSGAVRTQAITDAPARLTKSGAPTAPTCQILNLDIGPIHLDLLGLVVDLAPVQLDITAQTGPGNLLGNLLCALAGLLDPGPGPLAGIIQLLNQINAILAQLL
jgi:hypothetical protein